MKSRVTSIGMTEASRKTAHENFPIRQIPGSFESDDES